MRVKACLQQQSSRTPLADGVLVFRKKITKFFRGWRVMDWIGMGERLCPEPIAPLDGKGLSQFFMGKSETGSGFRQPLSTAHADAVALGPCDSGAIGAE